MLTSVLLIFCGAMVLAIGATPVARWLASRVGVSVTIGLAVAAASITGIARLERREVVAPKANIPTEVHHE